MQGMGRGNGQAQQTGQQMQNEAQQAAVDSMERRLSSQEPI